MQITRRSPRTGQWTTLDLPITEAQQFLYHQGNELIQNAFPDCTPAQREFYKTGYTQADWEAMFPPEEDD